MIHITSATLSVIFPPSNQLSPWSPLQPAKLEGEVKSTGYGDGAEEILQKEGLVDGKDKTILSLKVEEYFEEVDAADKVEHGKGHDKGEAVNGDENDKIGEAVPHGPNLLVLPVAVLDIPKVMSVRPVVGGYQAHQVAQRNHHLKELGQNKNLDQLTDLLHVSCTKVLPQSVDSNGEENVDQKVNAQENPNGHIGGRISNTDGQEEGMIGDGQVSGQNVTIRFAPAPCMGDDPVKH